MSTPAKKLNPATDMRTLIIALGGSGGQVLHNLYGLLTDEQKASANSIYLDLDSRDTTALRALGVNTIRISSADTVREMAASLGANDGVYTWLPHTDADSRFLASGTDDGASQYRYKSRLCLAHFLSNPSNELRRLLQELCRPGIKISKDTLRVMIVSSVAGGTGSGTFIDVALYVRKFFRDIGHPEVRIMGLFACPELFAQTLTNEGGDDNKRTAMYANAYAAIRELNAMNLAVSGECGIHSNYGRYINMSINTRSEGNLFDSKDPRFSKDYNTKPFDLLYFVDLANQDGGILGDLNKYYQTMADVAYTRLYSELEYVIRSDESNELSARAKNPTAIYGSAGYARIVYPYEDILRYLAEAKTYEELDTKWFLMETQWNNYKMKQLQVSNASGRHWEPTAREREQVFINTMSKALHSPNSPFQSIASMVGLSKSGSDRVTEYLAALNSAIRTSTGFEADGVSIDGPHGLGSVQDVQSVRKDLVAVYNAAMHGTDSYLNRLKKVHTSAKTSLNILVGKLTENITGCAVMLSSAILPTDSVSAQNAAAEKDPVNLYNSLLIQDGKDVHPMAARYLLYRVRQELRKATEGAKKLSCEEVLKQMVNDLDLCLDQTDDGKDTTVAEIVEDISNPAWWNAWNQENMARASLEMYLPKFTSVLDAILVTATEQLKLQAYTMVIENLNILISQYEGLYDNMEQYRAEMRQRADSDLVLHDETDDRSIYIAASSNMKQYYRIQPSVHEVLNGGSNEIYSAAGKSIYDALIKRTWKAVKAKQLVTASNGSWTPAEDHYDDLGNIFDQIVETYTKHLRERATYLQTSVMTALIRQCCNAEGLDMNDDLTTNAAASGRLKAAFTEYFEDMIAKAQPLLRYTRDNTDGYFQDERDSSVLYKNLGMSPAAAAELQRFYHTTDPRAALSSLKNDVGLAREPVVSAAYSDHEMFCFSAVHCLQPTQIYMFREDVDSSYYDFYRQRLAVAAATHSLAETPHIDKRWHVRGAIPYISPKLELTWTEKTMKAFLYLLLERKLCFDLDGMGIPRFYSTMGSEPTYIEWPYGTPVTKNSISRLLEYLADQEGLIERLSNDLDTILKFQISTLANYTHSLAVYKAGMTRNLLLRRMRTDMLIYEGRDSEITATHGKNAKKPKSNLASEQDTAAADALRAAISHEAGEAEEVIDLKKTMGGLLEFAWLIHKSEERLGEDRDYGEALLSCAANILDQFCRGMFGENLNPTSTAYKNYINLYNSTATKFLEEYVVATARYRKLTPEDLIHTSDKHESLAPPVTEGHTLELEIPDCIRNTDEFNWISKNWQLKGSVINH